MTREIKFRAWDGEEKRMYQPFTLHAGLNECARLGHVLGKNPDHYIYLQFTGMADIYEGDIVTCCGGYETVEGSSGECECPRGVMWEQEIMQFVAYCKNCREGTPLYEFDLNEVIGNIYQNPELLK